MTTLDTDPNIMLYIHISGTSCSVLSDPNFVVSTNATTIEVKIPKADLSGLVSPLKLGFIDLDAQSYIKTTLPNNANPPQPGSYTLAFGTWAPTAIDANAADWSRKAFDS